MTTPFIGQVTMGGWNFAPRGWALCEGQLVSIAQNNALFSLLGTTYGGDGQTTFGLPDLRGRLPMHEGSGPGLSMRPLGQKTGAETATISAGELPAHRHDLLAVNATAATQAPQGNLLAAPAGVLYAEQAPDTDMASDAVAGGGMGTAHDNLMPSQCITFVIALTGVFPSQF